MFTYKSESTCGL